MDTPACGSGPSGPASRRDVVELVAGITMPPGKSDLDDTDVTVPGPVVDSINRSQPSFGLGGNCRHREAPVTMQH